MKKIQITVMAGLISLFALDGIAGMVQPAPVVVDLVNRTAQGDQVTARFSANDVEFIGCGTRTFEDGVASTETGFCQAGDAEEVQFTCFTTNANLLSAIGRISDFSFITFSWNEVGECTRIGSSTQSFYLPKKLKP